MMEVSIDENGRMIIPIEFLKLFREEVILYRNTRQGCIIYLFNRGEWEKIEEKVLVRRKGVKPRDVKRIFCANTYNVKIKKGGRITFPSSMRELFKEDKKAVIVKAGNHLEIYPTASLDSRLKSLRIKKEEGR